MSLSSPEGYSMNDAISKEDCSFHYASADWAIAHIARLGPGILLVKMDIQQGYRNIPITPANRRLLGFIWEGKFT